MNEQTPPTALDSLAQLFSFIPDPALRLPVALVTLAVVALLVVLGLRRALRAKGPAVPAGKADEARRLEEARAKGDALPKPGPRPEAAVPRRETPPSAPAPREAPVAAPQRPAPGEPAREAPRQVPPAEAARQAPAPREAAPETAVPGEAPRPTPAPGETAREAPPLAAVPREAAAPRPSPAPQAAPAPAEAARPVVVPAEAAAPAEAEDVRAIKEETRESWLGRLRQGMAKSRDNLKASLTQLFGRGATVSEDLLEEIHEVLYRADMGVKTVDRLVGALRENLGKTQAEASWDLVRPILKDEITTILKAKAPPVTFPQQGPLVILIVGVNGVGKTTSIGKLAAHFLAQERRVILAAGDTFRAAAIEQLEVWGKRVGVEVVRHKHGSDPAAVAYDAVKAAMARQADVLLIDTAGRLHSKQELMAELAKIKKVVSRDLPGAPHEVWLVLDATTGQNAVAQVKTFKEVVDVTGLIVTKLDGTAKGGIVVGITDQFGLPVRYIGVGEKAADLREFSPEDFADSLV